MYTLLGRNRHNSDTETGNTYNKQRKTSGWFMIIKENSGDTFDLQPIQVDPVTYT